MWISLKYCRWKVLFANRGIDIGLETGGAGAGRLLGGYEKERVLCTGNVRKTNNEVLSCNHCFRGKPINITYSECVSVALFIQNAKRMRPVILLSVAYLYHIFPPIKSTIFGEKKFC